MDPDRLSLDDSNVKESSVCYMILILGAIDENYREYVKTATSKNKLSVKEDDNKIITYKQR